MVVHICNPTTREAEAGGLQVQGQPEMLSKKDPVSKKAGLEKGMGK